MPYHVLVLDGNATEGAAFAAVLQPEFGVTSCQIALKAMEEIKARRPDLMVMDLDLPDMDGLTFLRVLRDTESGRDLPVIVISSKKAENAVLKVFDMGAEDYLEKPFDPRELVARARTVLRRRLERLEHWGAAFSVAGIDLDPSQRRCVAEGKRITLRPREFELLEILMRKAGRVLSRAYLLETVWGMSHQADTRAVDVMISRLRRKLGRRFGKLIQTISKMGYTFAVD